MQQDSDAPEVKVTEQRRQSYQIRPVIFDINATARWQHHFHIDTQLSRCTTSSQTSVVCPLRLYQTRLIYSRSRPRQKMASRQTCKAA